VWGMPRYLPGVWSNGDKVRAESERMAASHTIQGSAQGMLQRSMVWLDRECVRPLQDAGEHVVWSLQIHDELLVRFRAELWDVLDEMTREALTQHHEFPGGVSVPIEAEGACAESWGKLKE